MFDVRKSRILGKISVLVAIFSFFFLTVNAQDGGNVLKSVQDKFNSVSDLTADVKYVSGGKTNFSGKVFFKKGNMFRVEYNNFTLVSDGSTTWNYNKKENKVVIDQFDSSNPLSVDAIINEYPSKSNVSTSTENGKSVITLTPKKDSDLNFNQVKLWVNNNNLVDKVSVTQHSGNAVNIEISNYKVNQKIADSQFSFNPPEGAKVIDLR